MVPICIVTLYTQHISCGFCVNGCAPNMANNVHAAETCWFACGAYYGHFPDAHMRSSMVNAYFNTRLPFRKLIRADQRHSHCVCTAKAVSLHKLSVTASQFWECIRWLFLIAPEFTTDYYQQTDMNAFIVSTRLLYHQQVIPFLIYSNLWVCHYIAYNFTFYIRFWQVEYVKQTHPTSCGNPQRFASCVWLMRRHSATHTTHSLTRYMTFHLRTLRALNTARMHTRRSSRGN